MKCISEYICEKLLVYDKKNKVIADNIVNDIIDGKTNHNEDGEIMKSYDFSGKKIWTMVSYKEGNEFDGFTTTYTEDNFMLNFMGLKLGDTIMVLTSGYDSSKEDIEQLVFHELEHVLYGSIKKPKFWIKDGFQFDPEQGTPLEFYKDDTQDIKDLKKHIDIVLYVLWNPDETHAFQHYSVYKEKSKVDEFCNRFKDNLNILDETVEGEETVYKELFMLFKAVRKNQGQKDAKRFENYNYSKFKSWFIKMSKEKYDDFYKKVIKNWKNIHEQ